jgi:hypothetical protein
MATVEVAAGPGQPHQDGEDIALSILQNSSKKEAERSARRGKANHVEAVEANAQQAAGAHAHAHAHVEELKEEAQEARPASHMATVIIDDLDERERRDPAAYVNELIKRVMKEEVIRGPFHFTRLAKGGIVLRCPKSFADKLLSREGPSFLKQAKAHVPLTRKQRTEQNENMCLRRVFLRLGLPGARLNTGVIARALADTGIVGHGSARGVSIHVFDNQTSAFVEFANAEQAQQLLERGELVIKFDDSRRVALRARAFTAQLPQRRMPRMQPRDPQQQQQQQRHQQPQQPQLQQRPQQQRQPAPVRVYEQQRAPSRNTNAPAPAQRRTYVEAATSAHVHVESSMTAALQQLSQQIADMRKELQELRQENARLRAENKELRRPQSHATAAAAGARAGTARPVRNARPEQPPNSSGAAAAVATSRPLPETAFTEERQHTGAAHAAIATPRRRADADGGSGSTSVRQHRATDATSRDADAAVSAMDAEDGTATGQ